MKRAIKSILTIALGTMLMTPLALVGLELSGHSPMPMINKTLNQLPISLASSVDTQKAAPVVIGSWPPVLGERFPDLVLSDQNGDTVRLSDLQGKILLIEYAAIPCAGCQAFAGGKERGAYGGFQVQPGLESAEHYAQMLADVQLGTDEVIFIQLLLYGKDHSSPTQEEVAGWAKHFGMDRASNQIVLRGDPSMLSRESYDMIPGFHLVDRDFTLRSDSCGHQPREDFYHDLLPLLGRLSRE